MIPATPSFRRLPTSDDSNNPVSPLAPRACPSFAQPIGWSSRVVWLVALGLGGGAISALVLLGKTQVAVALSLLSLTLVVLHNRLYRKAVTQDGVARKIKRCLDFTVALVGLTVTAPVLLLVAGAVILTMGRPIFFTQVRPGFLGKPFTMYKVRTMRNAFDKDGSPLSDADRLTPLGRFLRRWSIDELPQLWNVIRGDLSLVGPRPQLMDYLTHYTAYQARRHEVMPGLTGWAQICGRNAIDWSSRLELDVWYVDHWSLWLDFKILVKTIQVVILGSGISAPGHATMTRFPGNQALDCPESRPHYESGSNRAA